MPRGGKGKPFPPGVSGNPKGSSAKAQALAKVRRLTSEQLAHLTEDILLGDRDILGTIQASPDSSFLQVWTARLLEQSMLDGDVAAYRAILDRVCGKPKETVALGGEPGGAPVRVDYRTREEKLERLAVLQAARKQMEDHDRAPVGTDEVGKAERMDAPRGAGDHGPANALPGTE